MELMMSACKSMYASVLLLSVAAISHDDDDDAAAASTACPPLLTHSLPFAQICSFNCNQFINFDSYRQGVIPY